MHRSDPRSLDSTVLSARLGALAGHEREVQVEFLLHLDAFDQRRAWAEAGYASLWEWCLRVLHLREGAAGRRIAAMRVLRRFPALADALRDARLCMSTLALLGPILTHENCAEVVARAAFLTKSEVEHLVASLAPRPAPKEGVRLVSTRVVQRDPPSADLLNGAAPRGATQADSGALPTASLPLAMVPEAAAVPAVPAIPRRPSPATVQPVSAEEYSLRVTVDAGFKKDLDQLRSLLAHKIPGGELSAVLREAVRCALETHGKRRGAVERSRKVKPSPAKEAPRRAGAAGPHAEPAPGAKRREPIPAAVRREVWKRDGGSCTWRGEDGRRCGSTWKLELDHVTPAALGGASTVANLRLCCAAHNRLHAEQIFGRAHVDFFSHSDRRGAGTLAGGSA